MKTLLKLLVLLAVVAISCKSAEEKDKTAPVDVKSYTIEQFMSNINLYGGRFSHDESKLLIGSDETGIYNAYTLPVEGGELTPLTKSESTSIYPTSFFPKDDRVIYHSDNDGDEVFHIFLRDEDGTETDLTPGPARSTFYKWNFDEESFLYGSNKRDASFMDVYEMDIETMEAKMIFKNEMGLEFSGISRNEAYMVFYQSITTNNDNLILYTVADGSMSVFTEHEGDANHSFQGFSHDNTALFYTTNEGAEFTYLVKYELATGEKEKIMEYDWDISYSYLSYDGTYRVTGINEDAKTVIKLTNAETGKEIKFPAEITGDIKSVNISKSEKLMTFWVGSSKSPSELYIYNFDSGKAKKLLSGLNPEINPNDLVDGKVIRYPSFDGLEIPSILYKPKQASADNKVPALVWVHGGPGGQSRLSYFPLIQYLVNHGYVILAVNNRGSSGYGKTFYALDDRNHGEGDLMDCVKAKDYLKGTGYVDGENIGIIGGSYGGFMVMAALTTQPEEFKTGVNIFGVTNWVRTLTSIPPWWESFRKALYAEMGDPEVDSERLHRISPLFHADKITKPFMVVQGANDPRVLQVESDEIVEAARANGVDVEYLLMEDEGHGFAKKENQLWAYESILKFLDKELKGIEPEEEAKESAETESAEETEANDESWE